MLFILILEKNYYLAKIMNISIFAAIGSQNLWDELIVKNEIKVLREKHGEDTKFTVYSYDIESPFLIENYITYAEYFPIWIKQPKNIFRNIKNYFCFLIDVFQTDLVVIWWGWIFFDNEQSSVNNPLNQWKLRMIIFKLFQKKVLFYWVWIHLSEEKNINKIKSIFWYKNAEITVRDRSSSNILSKIWISSKIILDPVFHDNSENKNALNKSLCIDTINPKSFQIEDLHNYDFSYKTVGLAFRRWYFIDDEASMKEIIEFLLAQKAKIILIPNSIHPLDKSSDDYLFLNIFAQTYNLEILKNISKSYTAYKERKIDICFAMRLHSIILSQVYDIPYIAFSYSQKTDEILKIIKK